MIANGDDEVNGYRALLASCVTSEKVMSRHDLERASVANDVDAAPDEPPGETGAAPREKSSAEAVEDPLSAEVTDDDGRKLELAQQARVSCFVHLRDPAGAGDSSGTADGSIAVHELTMEQVEAIRRGEEVVSGGQAIGRVAYVETGSPLAPPKPRLGSLVAGLTSKRTAARRSEPGTNDAPFRPQVIVGIIDVGGFDFSHDDFAITRRGRAATKYLAVWDQGLIDDFHTDAQGSYQWKRELPVAVSTPGVGDLREIVGIRRAFRDHLIAAGIETAADLSMLLPDELEELLSPSEFDDLRDHVDPADPTQWLAALLHDTELLSTVTVPFGAIHAHSDFDYAVRTAEAEGLEPLDFITQTAEDPGSHATHVASIAAGNQGTCPDAWIVGVSIAMTNNDDGRRASIYDSTRLGQAIDFITDVGDAAGLPVAINISLGTNGHAHDGTSPINKWIESTLREQGRVICVAAGNSGKETASYEGDVGFMSGRIHASGRIPAKDLIVELGWQVVGNGVVDVSENEMEIWYNPGDEFAVQMRTPSGEETDWVRPGAFLENWRSTSDTFLSIYSERFIQANGANRISLFLSPKYKGDIAGVQPGLWTVRLRGERIRDGRFDAWIERDDPRPVGVVGESNAWICPSYFSLDSNVDSSSLNSLGCSQTVIAVANVEGRGSKIHSTSSQGPTRDGRQKPDIAAPGTDIAAARGFSSSRGQWIEMTGTSMASPYVSGIAACMLIEEPSLTAGQILGIMRSTAQPLPGSDYAWRDDAGFGVIDEKLSLEEVARVFQQVEAKPDTKSPASPNAAAASSKSRAASS